MSERRQIGRCPVCQGPTKEDPSMPEGMRCRRSICSYNHEHVECPRCKGTEHDVTAKDDGSFSYTCQACLHTFSS